jgi:5-methylcytosine-specific restriction endonuclease McrA
MKALFRNNSPRILATRRIQCSTQTNCAYCGVILDEKNRTIDHIIPIDRGGTPESRNVIACCVECNIKKGNKTAQEFGFPEIQKQTEIPYVKTTEPLLLNGDLEMIRKLTNVHKRTD